MPGAQSPAVGLGALQRVTLGSGAALEADGHAEHAAGQPVRLVLLEVLGTLGVLTGFERAPGRRPASRRDAGAPCRDFRLRLVVPEARETGFSLARPVFSLARPIFSLARPVFG